jgi:uncharacterized membrane protein YccC
MASPPRSLVSAPRRAWQRLRPRLIPILQTATAAVAAWYLAELLLSDERPAFASIAAVISLGATYGERRSRALQLVGGVVLGILTADAIISLIGSGPQQIGLMVLLAMSAAVLLGGGELVVAESAVSAILLVVLAPGSDEAFSLNRVLEAVIGGSVGLVVASFFFPPDPRLLVDRPMQAVFGGLGRSLQLVAEALRTGEPATATRAVEEAARIDALLRGVQDALVTGRETARFAPPRRTARSALEPFDRSIAQLDFAVRDTRSLARYTLRSVRAGIARPGELPAAVDSLAEAVWALAASYEAPERTAEVRRLALEAADRATGLHAGHADLATSEIIVQVRSTAVDLVRAAELVAGRAGPEEGTPTVELLVPERPG